MRELIEAALRGLEADYVDIRIERSEATRIAYRGRHLEDVGRSLSIGGNVRALVRGGWGFVSFNRLEELPEKTALAVHHARLVGDDGLALAPVEPVNATEQPQLDRNPTAISLEDKRDVLDEYNDTLWQTQGLQASFIRYSDSKRELVFANSEGAYIEQTKVDVAANITAVARKDGDVQQASLSIGGSRGFGCLEGLQGKVRQTAERAVGLLSAKPVPGGEYTVICDPILAGVFIHEAFGHLSEADFVHENERIREIMVLGRRFGGKHLNVVDGAAYPGLRGSYAYDDEGVPASKTQLIHEGVLVGRLHSRETAARMGEKPTGNARALNYRHHPIVRMTNTMIQPGDGTFEEMLAEVELGIYAKSWFGGTTSMEMFTFSAGAAHMIRDGRLAEPLRGVVLTGNVFETLANIDAIGSDLEMQEGGGCGKGGQIPLPVSMGSPHIRIRRCVVGGR